MAEQRRNELCRKDGYCGIWSHTVRVDSAALVVKFRKTEKMTWLLLNFVTSLAMIFPNYSAGFGVWVDPGTPEPQQPRDQSEDQNCPIELSMASSEAARG